MNRSTFLPWISRAAYLEVCRQRDRLEAQNDALLAHVVRMDRIEHGAPELAPERRKTLAPMPKHIVEYITGFQSDTIRQRIRREYETAAAKVGWDEVWNRIKEAEGAADQAPA